jgi:hypothetical protein
MATVNNQLARIQAVFGLCDDAPLPRVNRNTLRRYHEHLAASLSVPFDALYAETKPPIRHLVHFVRVVRIRDVEDRISDGLICEVQNSQDTRSLPLAEIGVREDDSNYQLIDDYAYWFINSR